MAFVFGIDVGGSSCKLGLFGQEGNLLFQAHFPTGKGRKPEELIQIISGEMQKAMDFLQANKKDLMGIGIGFPGPVTDQSQVHGCVNFGWENFNAQRGLEEIWEVPVKAENDANLAALGEGWKGAGASFDSFIFLALGTGIGAGLVYEKRLIRGERGGAGEVGHMPIFTDKKTGQVRDLESLASANAMAELARKKLYDGAGPSSLSDFEKELSARRIVKEAMKKDPLACEILQETADHLGQGLACISAVFDPQAFILGGGMSLAGDRLLKPTLEAYQKYVFPPLKGTPILLSSLGDRAGMFGATRYILGEGNFLC